MKINQFTSKIKDFYLDNFLIIRDKVIVNHTLAFILLIWQSLQLLSFCVRNSILDLIIPQNCLLLYLNKIMSITLYFIIVIRFYPLFEFEGYCNQSTLLFVGCSIFIMVIFLMITHIIFQQSQKNQQPRLTTINQIVFNSKHTEIIETIFAIFFKLYPHLMHWPLTIASLEIIQLSTQTNQSNCEQIGLILSFIILITSAIIFLFIYLHNFDFHYRSFDQLAECNSSYSAYNILFIYLLLILGSFVKNSQIWIGVSYNLFSVIISNTSHNYVSTQTNSLQKYCVSQMLLFNLIIIVLTLIDSSVKSFNIYYVFAFPFVQYIQYTLIEKEGIYNLDRKPISPFLDVILRSIYSKAKQAFKLKGSILNQPILRDFRSCQLHTLAANHLYYCQLNRKLENKKCFCYDYFPNQSCEEQKSWAKYSRYPTTDTVNKVEKENFEDEAEFKKFIFDLIKYHYEKNLSVSDKHMQFSYIYFLFEVVKQPTKAFSEALNLQNTFKDLRSMMIIRQLIREAKKNFDSMIDKRELKNQKYDLKMVLDLDDEVKICKSTFASISNSYRKWYQIIINQQVNLEQLKQKGIILLKQLNSLELNLQGLFLINPNSLEVEQMMHIYYKYLNQNRQRPQKYKRKSAFILQTQIKMDMFDRNAAVVYISLMQPRGTIRSYTKNFKIAVGCSDREIMDQNIKNFMPDILAIHHDMYLETFIEKGRMNIVRAENRFLLVKNKQQFIFPVNARVRLDNYSYQDFGASALLNRINQQYFYMVINKYGLLEELSENLFKTVFKKVLDLNLVKWIDLLKMMPLLYKKWNHYNHSANEDLEEDQGLINHEEILDEYLVIPKNPLLLKMLQESKTMAKNLKVKIYRQKQQRINYNYFSQLDDAQIYQIKYKIKNMQTINFNMLIIEIIQMKTIKQQSKFMILQQISRLLDIEQSPQILKTTESDQIFDMNQYDLEPNFMMEEFEMIREKEMNIFQHIPPKMTANRYDTHINSVMNREQSELLQCGSKILQISESPIPRTILEFNNDQIKKESSVSNCNKSDSNSSEKQKQENIRNNDASSVASSTNQDDHRSKLQLIRSVLDSEQGYQNQITNFFVIFGFLCLIVFYLINIYFIIVNKSEIDHNFTYYQQASKLTLPLNLYILCDQIPDLQNVAQNHFNENLQILQLFQSTNVSIKIQNESLVLDSYYISRYISVLMISDDTEFKEFITLNYKGVISTFDTIQEIQTQFYNDQIEGIQQKLVYLLIVAETTFILLILLVIPGYFMINQMKNKILNYFISFNQKEIQYQHSIYQAIYEQLRYQIQEEVEIGMINVRQVLKTLKSTTTANRSLQQLDVVKSKSITLQNNTTQLILISLMIFLFFSMMSLYLIISFIIQEVFYSTLKDKINQIAGFQNIHEQVILGSTLQRIIQFTPLKEEFDYLYQNISFNNGDRTFLDNQVNTQIRQILEKDACTSISYLNLTLEECQMLELNNGLSLSLINIFNIQQQFYDQASIATDQELQTQVNLIFANSKWRLVLYLSDALCTINEILINSIYDLSDSTQTMQLIVFSIALSLIIIFSILTNRYLKSVLNTQILQCKKLLTLIPFEMLCKNAYVMSYIVKQAAQQ